MLRVRPVVAKEGFAFIAAFSPRGDLRFIADRQGASSYLIRQMVKMLEERSKAKLVIVYIYKDSDYSYLKETAGSTIIIKQIYRPWLVGRL